MGFAAIARVTEDRWITCLAKDNLKFGLKPGDELKVESTIGHEIEKSHRPVVISNVAEDAAFCKHHTPIQYGFQSYISVPIILKNNQLFGTFFISAEIAKAHGGTLTVSSRADETCFELEIPA